MSSVTFAKNCRLEEIGESAFAYCLRLGSLAIPDSVRTVGDSAFNRCVTLRNVTVGTGVETLGKGVFEHCVKMTRLAFTASPKQIGEDLVKNHSSRLTVVCPGTDTEIYAYLQANYMKVKIQVSKKK